MILIISILLIFMIIALFDNILRSTQNATYARFLGMIQPNTGDWLPAVVFWVAMVMIFWWFRIGGI